MGNNQSNTETEQKQSVATNCDDGLVRPLFENGRYQDPFKIFKEVGLKDVFRMLRSKDNSEIPWKNEKELDANLPIIAPDFEKLKNPPSDKMQVMWIGHASILVQFDGLTIVTDPVFGDKCGPFGIMGPKRYRKPPCKIEDIPHIDAVVISHNHYDHLDHESVVKLNRKFGNDLRWYVAKGQEQWMRDQGCTNVVELTWWQEHTYQKDGQSFMFAATPALHWCQRTAFNKNKALWCSWTIKGPKHSFYFAGDTAYCPAFQQIGKKYGPFSLAAIPIGAYEPRWFMQSQHVNPEEAVTLHQEIKSRCSVGIHWGTFRLTSEYYMEPKQKLSDILKERGLHEGEFITVKHGDVVIIEEPES